MTTTHVSIDLDELEDLKTAAKALHEICHAHGSKSGNDHAKRGLLDPDLRTALNTGRRALSSVPTKYLI